MDCPACLELLYAFLDGELEPGPSGRVQDHLDTCGACFDRSQVEEAFRRAIRACAPVEACPPGLEDRLRRALDAEDAWPAGANARGRAGRPSPRLLGIGLAAAAALAVAWVLLPLRGSGSGRGGEAAAVANPIQIEGRLFCLGCLLGRQRPRDPAGRVLLPGEGGVLDDRGLHDRLLFMSDAGDTWELAPSQVAAGAVRNHDNDGRAVTLIGTALPAVKVIEVARLSFL
jgi:mycothiol system anti-sigma-R factor